MSQKEYSDYQKAVISNYSNNLDIIMLQKLSELVSELYLTDSDKKREKLWERVYKAMTNLKIPDAVVDHIMAKRNVEILAKNLNDWLKKK
jgi:hypothetical protein